MKPSFQAIVAKQQVAAHRLRGKTTHSDPEIAHCRRVLQPVPLADLILPTLPLVRPVGGLDESVMLGEIAQSPGQVLLFNLKHHTLSVDTSDNLELVPPRQG